MLPIADLADAGLARAPLDRLRTLVAEQVDAGRYYGAQYAIARHGRLVLAANVGLARIAPRTPVEDATLWVLASGTKVLTMAGIWALVEDGKLAFADRLARHVPEFAAEGKQDITILQVATHRGGFPSPDVTAAAWGDPAELRRQVCGWTLEWEPGSRTHYHVRSAHWALAMLIESVSGEDLRTFLRRRVLEPLGLAREIYLGLPESEHERAADLFDAGTPPSPAVLENSPAWRAAGVPSSGAYATARGLAMFYQMLGNRGRLGGVRLFSPRLIEYVTRNFTGELLDGLFGVPMRRGLGPHVRGTGETVRSLGSLAAPATFGQGGNGASVAFVDPQSQVSFAYVTNVRQPEPWHSERLERIANLVHAAID